MKRHIIIIVVSAILIGLMIFEQIYIRNTLDELREQTLYLYSEIHSQEIINTEDLIFSVEKLDSYWKTKENFLCLTINHKDMEKIGEQITKLITYINQNNKEDAEYEVELLKYFVEGNEHIMIANFQNIW